MKDSSQEKFRELVSQRTKELEQLAFDDLKRMGNRPTEQLAVGRRAATIDIIVQYVEDGSLRIVVQGFMRSRLLPLKDVALGGFYKFPNGHIRPMPEGGAL
jgi:hypothetical protein